MPIGPTQVEVERPTSQRKTSLLLNSDENTAIAEDVARQLVTSGRHINPKQIENAVDVVTLDEFKRVAQEYLWDQDITLAAVTVFSIGLQWNQGTTSRAPSARPATKQMPRSGTANRRMLTYVVRCACLT